MVQKIEIHSYFAIVGMPPLILLRTQIWLAERSRTEGFRFLKKVLQENCPNFHGLWF